MSTENESDTDDESEYGAVDPGWDEDEEMFSRNTGKTASVGGGDPAPAAEQSNVDSGVAADSVETPETSGGETETSTIPRGGNGSERASRNSENDVEHTTTGERASPDAIELDVVERATPIETPPVAPGTDDEFPFLFTRSGAQDARDHDWIYFQPHVKDAYKEARRQAEDIFGDDMTETDLKEAIFIAGLRNFEVAVETMHDWGCRADSR
jgi:hypothetical protein